jgi:uncharacterized protein (DUF433 family)
VPEAVSWCRELFPGVVGRVSFAVMSNVAAVRVFAGGCVVSNPALLGGAPVFRGTRLPVQTLFDYLADGLSLDYFLETFEGVTREQASAVIRHGWLQIAAEVSAAGPSAGAAGGRA